MSYRALASCINMRLGLYASVSTHDQHTLQKQMEALQAYTEERVGR